MNSVIKKYTRNGEQKEAIVSVLEGDYLINRTVLITGGSTGIGYSIAEACLRNGANVIIASRNEDKLKVAKDKLRHIGRGNVETLQFDINKPLTFDTVIEEAANLCCGVIDTLVNSAGLIAGDDFGDTSLEDFEKVLDTNLKGTYFFSQAFANYMIRNKISGNILMISSVSGVRPAATPYMISKWGVVGMTSGLAKKLIKYDIVVNGIGPGPVPTPLMKMDPDGDYTKPNSPSGRYIVPEEVSNIAVFLISNMARMIVGETVFVTGGVGRLTFDDICY